MFYGNLDERRLFSKGCNFVSHNLHKEEHHESDGPDCTNELHLTCVRSLSGNNGLSSCADSYSESCPSITPLPSLILLLGLHSIHWMSSGFM